MDTGPLSGPFGRHDPSLPQVFGRYLLVQRLSRGGMGEIFLAKHGLAGFEKLAVIKKVLQHLSADEQFISRFVDEAQVAIKLSHVNVAQVFEVGRVGDEYFLALEYIEGRDLRRMLAVLGQRRERLPVDLALFIVRELANGLAYAHRRTTSDGASLNLVHCDISPPNVLVSFEGETKVIDFGIAKSAMRGTATDPKVGFGKFGYMAPEQLIRGGVVDFRTDIYAAGVVLFELLTGTRLYEAGPEPDYRALAKKVARGEHQLPSQTDPALAPYDELVATALRPKPDDRYQSAAELRDAIQQCLVAVNPTISTDQLGAYMRLLFADEMTAQRELHERVASAHLADFQEQFHTQTIDTVSFAVAPLPLPPPEATGRHARRASTQPGQPGRPRTGPNPTVGSRPRTGPNPTIGRPRTGPNPTIGRPRTGPNPTIGRPRTGPSGEAAKTRMTSESAERSSPVIPTTPPAGAVPPVGAPITLDERDVIDAGPAHAVDAQDSFDALASHDVSDEDRTTALRRRHRAIVIASSAAIVLLAVFGVWGVAMTDDAKPRKPPARLAPAAPPVITVEPIPTPPLPADRDEPEIEVEPTPYVPPHPPAKAAAAPPKAVRAPVHKDVRPAPPPPPPALSREQLGQKFQQVRREYDDYKAKFGSRLEREWGELATFIQYMPGSDDDAARREAARRLDTFRGRMRE